jgi:plastocyanin
VFAAVLGAGAFACNNLTTNSVGPPDHLLKSGDQQNWYFNNPLPVPLTVGVFDANNQGVPGVSVDWSINTGGGSLTSNTTTTNANGVANNGYTLGTASLSVVRAGVSGLTSVMFVANGQQPGTAVGVTVSDNAFTPKDTAVQVGGTVTWTWAAGATQHTVTYTGGPTTPTSSGTLTAGATFNTTFPTIGTYTYHCLIHPTTMTGTVTVVQ